MLDSSQDKLLKILKDFIYREKTVLEIDDKVINLAKNQMVGGIVYYQTNTNILKNDYLNGLYTYCNRKKIEKEIFNALKKENIQFFLFKGTRIAEYYPVKALRSMSDSDIMVHAEDLERAGKVLEDLGFDKQSGGDIEWVYLKDKYQLELHCHLLYEVDFLNSEKSINLMEKCWGYVHSNELDWNFHFIYLILHIKKHILYSGIGIRQFLDLAIIQYQTELNYKWIRQKLEEIDLFTFAKVVLSLNEAWFGVVSPFEKENVEESYEIITDKILGGSVFGDFEEENQNRAVNKLNNGEKVFTLKGLISSIFLKYDQIITIKRYSYVKNRKYLLWIAWIHRWLYSLKNIKSLKTYAISKNDIEQRQDYLKLWKL